MLLSSDVARSRLPSSAAARRWLNCITKWPLIHYEFDDFWKNTLKMQLLSSPNDLASCNVIAHFKSRWLNYWGKEWTGWWVLVVQSFTYRSLKPWSEVTFAHNSFKISDFVPNNLCCHLNPTTDRPTDWLDFNGFNFLSKKKSNIQELLCPVTAPIYAVFWC